MRIIRTSNIFMERHLKNVSIIGAKRWLNVNAVLCSAEPTWRGLELASWSFPVHAGRTPCVHHLGWRRLVVFCHVKTPLEEGEIFRGLGKENLSPVVSKKSNLKIICGLKICKRQQKGLISLLLFCYLNLR